MSASSHSLSFPALLAQLRSLLPADKHAALDAVSVSFNDTPSDKASVQRRLCEIAGKEVVQAAVLHLLGQQDCNPPGLATVTEEAFAPLTAEVAMTVGVASNNGAGAVKGA